MGDHDRCRSKKCKSSKSEIRGRLTFCPDECELEKLKNDIHEFLDRYGGSFSTRDFSYDLQKELCDTGVIDISPATVAASDNTVRITINFPQECCLIFNVTYTRRDGRIWSNGGCSDGWRDIIFISDSTRSEQPKISYIIFGCNKPCRQRCKSEFQKPKYVKKTKRVVECEDTESSSSSSSEEECEISCKKCKKVCKCEK